MDFSDLCSDPDFTDYEMENLIPCTKCGKMTSFQRDSREQPHEGEICPICDEWICLDCVDWEATNLRNDEWVVCKECAKLTVEEITKEV